MKISRLPILIFPLIVLPLSLPLSGSLDRALKTRTPSKHFEQLAATLRAMFARGEYQEALSRYRAAADEAGKAGEPETRLFFLNNAGGCQLALFQYSDALKSLTEVRRLAYQAGDRRGLARADGNISSIYSQMGNLSESAAAAERAIQYRDAMNPRARAILLLQLGTVRAQMGNLEAAEPVFLEGIETAVQADDRDAAAWGWDYLGYARRKAGKISAAELAATEGFRLRKLCRLGAIESSYMNLGAIRAAQGDTGSAIILLDEAEKALHRATNRTPAWHIYTERGKVKLMAGQLEPALVDLRRALDLARIWRVDVVANDANRSSSEGTLAELYGLLIDAGNRLYLVKHDPALIRETFEAAEENRAASLRALIPQADDWRNRLSGEYWQSLAKLPAAEAGWLQSDKKAATAVSTIRSQLDEMEAEAGAPARLDHGQAYAHARAALDSHSTLFSFRLGDSQSWVWAVTNGSIALETAPGRKELAGLIEKFAESVARGSLDANPDANPDAKENGGALYRGLFGSIQPEILSHDRWLLALEGELFKVPFPALPDGQGELLIAKHSLQTITGAIMVRKRPAEMVFHGPFLGVGDPIYNNADSRAKSTPTLSWDSLRPSLLYRASYDRQPTFARLLGTGREVQTSARAWAAERSILLTGADASESGFWAATLAKPDIIHLATHILEKNDRLQTGWIALSRGHEGRLDYLTPTQISARSISAQLVVLSGCSSGKAEIRTASGLMGLTRAWIAAGAGSVLATRWPTIDDDGVFFDSFYRNFRRNPDAGPAGALRQASLEMLNSGTWRANPSFWAGYFLVGNY